MSPWGFAVNTKDDRAMAARSTIIHDDRKAEALFILENILCMLEMRRNSNWRSKDCRGVLGTCGSVRSRSRHEIGLGLLGSSVRYLPHPWTIMSTTESPPPPTPLHLLRSHLHPISALAWSDDNERIYSADTSGKIVVTSTRSLRTITAWNAHTDSILGVEEWDKYILS